MRTRTSRLLVGGFVVALLAGSSFMPAGSAENKVNLGSFIGQAGSHAVKISIGDIELAVGGGESNAGYKRTQNSPIKVLDQLAKAVSRGVVIPGLADSHVSCEPPTLADEVTALSTPEALEPLLSLDLGMATCALGGMKGLPTAEHAAGEVLADPADGNDRRERPAGQRVPQHAPGRADAATRGRAWSGQLTHRRFAGTPVVATATADPRRAGTAAT